MFELAWESGRGEVSFIWVSFSAESECEREKVEFQACLKMFVKLRDRAWVLACRVRACAGVIVRVKVFWYVNSRMFDHVWQSAWTCLKWNDHSCACLMDVTLCCLCVAIDLISRRMMACLKHASGMFDNPLCEQSLPLCELFADCLKYLPFRAYAYDVISARVCVLVVRVRKSTVNMCLTCTKEVRASATVCLHHACVH